MKHDFFVVSAQFSPDGKRIVTASWDKTARVWDAQTGRALTEPMKHDGEVRSAQFSPDGKRIATASGDKTARIWDAQTGTPLTEPLKHDGDVRSAQFSPDGERIVTASGDKTARIWDSSPSKPCPEWLIQLADAMAGQHLNDRGFFEPLNKDSAEILEEIRSQLSRDPSTNDWTVWGRWFLADRSTRTISPFSRVTVPEYIENRIKENTPASLDEAESLAVGNPKLLQRIKQARESLPSAAPIKEIPQSPTPSPSVADMPKPRAEPEQSVARGAHVPSAGQQPMEWRKQIKPQHIESVESAEALAVGFNSDRLAALAAGPAGPGEEDATKDLPTAIELLKPQDRPFKEKDLLGMWHCRSIQADGFRVTVYPSFNCRFIRKDRRLFFEKTNGSQRRSGYLYPNAGDHMVFLGSLTMNDDVNSGEYTNTVGVLVRKASNRLLLILDATGQGYEIYEIVK
jgi:WD40 repeat protein